MDVRYRNCLKNSLGDFNMQPGQMMSHLKDFRQEVFNKSADGSYWKQSGERDVWRGSEKKARRQTGMKGKEKFGSYLDGGID